MNVSGSLFFLFLLFPLMTSKNICPVSSCSNSSFNIRFPFYTTNHSLDCSYPGFNLSCTKQGLTSINLPYSGKFLIRDINYQKQEIQIYDPESCLAKRLLSFNLSNSVFNSPYYVKLTFLTCSADLLSTPSSSVIGCLSNSKNLTVAASPKYAILLYNRCQTIGTFKIPVLMSWSSYYGDYFFPNLVSNDILLTWDRPNCKTCEKGGENRAIKTKIVALCITVPVVSFVIFLLLSLCITQQSRNLATEEIIIIQPPNITPPTRGLDDSTIATYQQVTLGESKRLPGSGDETCVICLSEFCAKDTIRVIPECNHCFHTTCIDEWLRMRGSCPVCRNSPLPAHVEA